MRNKRFDIIQHIEYIERRIEAGDSLRMIAESLSISHDCLSDNMKKVGMHVPTREESAKNTWKNHKHPNIGEKGELSHLYGKHQSKDAIEKRAAMCSGHNNYHWSGGRKMHSEGYVVCYHPEHPHANKHGFVMEHRYVMEQHIGRYLTDNEIVHHINGIKTDNRVENLMLMSRSEHCRHHMNENIGGMKRAQLNRNCRKTDV